LLAKQCPIFIRKATKRTFHHDSYNLRISEADDAREAVGASFSQAARAASVEFRRVFTLVVLSP
jgi:hypothetical protein